MTSWTERGNIPRYNYAIQEHVDINGPEKDGISIKKINFVYFPEENSGIHYHLKLKGDSKAVPNSDKAKKQLDDIVNTYDGAISFNNGQFNASLPINWTSVTLEKRLNELEKGGFLEHGDGKKIAEKIMQGINSKVAEDAQTKKQPGYSKRAGSYIRIENPAAEVSIKSL